MKLWTEAILHTIYPELCLCCKQAIKPKDLGLCLQCEYDLPLYEDDIVEHNNLNKTFWGRVPTQRVYSFLLMKSKNNAQSLIHALKYKSKKNVALKLGRKLGRNILDSPYYKKPDILIPIPLHPKKQKIRGYNQAELIADAVSEELLVPVRTDIVKRLKHQSTQTKKDREERWKNVDSIFAITTHEHSLNNQHIMIIDDVITTGATIDACAQAFREINGIRISAASLAYAP